MKPAEDYTELIELLNERGHTQPEIEKIVESVRVYDLQTRHDSLMDMIGSGQISLDAFVKDVLKN